MEITAYDIRIARRYLAAYASQRTLDGRVTAYTCGCGLAQNIGRLPGWSLDDIGPMWWGDAGRIAAERVLAAAEAQALAAA